MKVLVTGAAGFVGRHMLKELGENGHDAIAVVHESEPDIENFETIHVDLNDYEAVRKKIDYKKIGSVIHLAGLAAVGPSFNEPMKYIATNIGIETNLFEAALLQKQLIRFLITSSGAVYSPNQPMPLTEDAKIIASSPYVVSKIGQEQMAVYYGSRGFECIIARPFNHIGPGQREGFLIPDLAKQVIAIENGGANEIAVGNLDAKRDYTDVRDIVRCYRLLIEKGNTSSTYNICSGKSLSGKEILKLILNQSEARPRVVEDTARMRPSDAPEIYGDASKIAKDTGWQPSIPIEQTIKDVLKEWRTS